MGSRSPVTIRLADVCRSIDYGYTASASAEPRGPRFLRITDIVGSQLDWRDVPFVDVDDRTAEKYRLRHGDVVVARTGASTGESAWISNPPDAVFASYLVRLQVDPDLADSRFIAYWLKSSQFRDYMAGVLGDKSAQPNASASTMTNAPLDLPPLDEQRRIASIVGALDDKIELNRRTRLVTGEIARWYYESRFGESAPPTASNGWREATIGDVVEQTKELIDPRRSPEELFDHFSIPAFDEGQTPSSQVGAEIKSTKYRVVAESVLMSKLNPVTPRVWWPSLRPKRRSIASTEFLVLVPKGIVTREWLFGLLESVPVTRAMRSMVTGTSGSHQRVAPGAVMGVPILLPPERDMAEYSSVTAPLRARQALLLEESQTLSHLRDVLIPGLMTGSRRDSEGES